MTDQLPPAPPAAPAPEAPVEELTQEEIDALDPNKAGDPPPADETPEQKDARIAALEERNKALWGWNQRLRKKPASPAAPAAPAAPVAPVAPATPPATPATSPGLTREEGILFSKGFSEAEVEQAKKVATLQGVKLTDAVTDPLFTTWKAIEDKKAKDAAAQLPPSRGARPTVKKTLATPGLSDAEHKELFNEKVGR